MKQVKYLILLSVFSFSITMSIAQSKGLVAFIEKFDMLEFPLEINEQPFKNNKTIFTKGFNRNDFLKYLNGIKEPITEDTYFYYGGRIKYKGFDILIYRISDFGDAPALDIIKIELVVFNSEGKMLSKMVIGGQEIEEKQINCILNQNMTFEVSILNSSNNLIRSQKYFIDIDGKIKKRS